MGANVIVAEQEMQIRKQKNELSAIKAQNATLTELAEQIDFGIYQTRSNRSIWLWQNHKPHQIVLHRCPQSKFYTLQYAVVEKFFFFCLYIKFFEKELM